MQVSSSYINFILSQNLIINLNVGNPAHPWHSNLNELQFLSLKQRSDCCPKFGHN